MTARLRFLRAERVRSGILLVFESDADGDLREVSAFIPRCGRRWTVIFPHGACETGESLGSEAAGDAVGLRARQVTALLDAASEWAAFRREAS